MAVIGELLAPDESLELETRRHPGLVARRAVAFAVVTGGALLAGALVSPRSGSDVLDLALTAVVVLFALRLLIAVVSWRTERIAVTERRLIAVTGAIRRRVTSVPLRRIHAASLSRSGWDRVFGAGDLVLDLGGQGSLRVERVARPKAAYRVLTSLLDDEPARLRPVDEGEEADTGPLPRVVL